MTPTQNDSVIGDKVRSNLKSRFMLLALYAGSLISACLWAVVFRVLLDHLRGQLFWNLFYLGMEFI